jgi:hypothetical protein
LSQLAKCPDATESYQVPKYSSRSAHQEPFERERVAVEINQYDEGYVTKKGSGQAKENTL